MLLHIRLLVFLNFIAIKGVLGRNDVCPTDRPEVCALPDDFRFPATEADVDRICPQIIQHMDCLDDRGKCLSEDDWKRNFRQDLRVLVEDGCRTDSQLHSRIIVNVGCLHETYQNDLQACQEYFDEKRRALSKHIQSISNELGSDEDEFEDDILMPVSCLLHSLEAVCIANKSYARCGTEARDLVLELVGRTGFLQQHCAEANEERLAEFIKVLKFESEEEITFNRILGKE